MNTVRTSSQWIRAAASLALAGVLWGGECHATYTSDHHHCPEDHCSTGESTGGPPETETYRLTEFRINVARGPGGHLVRHIFDIRDPLPALDLQADAYPEQARRLSAELVRANPDLLAPPPSWGPLVFERARRHPHGGSVRMIQAWSPGVLELRFAPDGRLETVDSSLQAPAAPVFWGKFGVR